MPSVSYMPDAARAAMPQSALQPLPPYLREDFSQSLDRTRPHQLIVPNVTRGGKSAPRDPSRASCLQYRYLDTQETVTVPNIWYNQTRAMRMAHWQRELEQAKVALAHSQRELDAAKAAPGPLFRYVPKPLAVLAHTRAVENQCRRLAGIQTAHDEVQAGVCFV